MSVANVVYETVSSRRAQLAPDRSSSVDWALRITGSDILDDVIQTAFETFPQALYEPHADLWLVPGKTSFTPLGPGHADLATPHASWDVVCSYIDPAKADDQYQLAIGECRLQASTVGGTVKILTSLETVGKYKRPADRHIPNFKGALNVTRDNEVKGVDKVVPSCKFTVSMRLAQGQCSNLTLAGLEAMTGTYNDDLWWDRPAGEVLFLGVDVTVGSRSAPTLDYHFLRIPNLNNLMISDIGPITKLGHHFLWVLFEETPQSGAGYMPAVPRAVYVERIYEPSSFGNLGLPTDAPPIAPWPPV